MLDLHLYQFIYTTDPDDPYHLEIGFNNVAVAVGFAPGDNFSGARAFEVIDKFDGRQLACININHVDIVVAWQGIVTKAHHLALELHAEAVEQAARDKAWTQLLNQAMSRFENIDQYLAKSSELIDSRNVTTKDVEHMAEVVRSLTVAGDKLDLIADPD